MLAHPKQQQTKFCPLQKNGCPESDFSLGQPFFMPFGIFVIQNLTQILKRPIFPGQLFQILRP